MNSTQLISLVCVVLVLAAGLVSGVYWLAALAAAYAAGFVVGYTEASADDAEVNK